MLASLLPAAAGSHAADAGALLQCPPVLAATVAAKRYPGWFVYSNDPLRLTGADIAYVADHEDALLDPDEVRQLNDNRQSVVQTFRLARHRDVRNPSLVCHYGVHAQLSRDLPHGTVECKVVHRVPAGPDDPEFEASCR